MRKVKIERGNGLMLALLKPVCNPCSEFGDNCLLRFLPGHKFLTPLFCFFPGLQQIPGITEGNSISHLFCDQDI